MKRSTKPASPSSDSGRRDSSRGKGRGDGGEERGEGFREVTRTHLACRRRGALVYTPFVFVPTVAKSSSLREGRIELETDDVLISFLAVVGESSEDSHRLVDRFEGYGVIKRLVKRGDGEESRERKKKIVAEDLPAP
ncbi:hypothetical protein ALC60_00814 [Trachymyrmex zeteki]|uniref:Uncharacterized protein n=1 Tax=Mycetomoellerius zeteki TaxID=64791 RepID=A0A151XJ14_9HYME|nr:hypothetical protein ALC60_00814 [Trachymyrmex zeteki]